jgi:hypothetical protein
LADSTTPIPEASQTLVEEPQATLLARLQAGWAPLPFVLPPVVAIRLGEQDITRQLISIRLVGETLQVRFRDRKADLFSVARIHARTVDGGILTARISDSSRQFLLDDPVNRMDVVAHCREWTYSPAKAPALWIAALASMSDLPGPGNLAIRWQRQDRGATASTNLRLHRPGLTSFFVETKQRNPDGEVWLCLDEHTGNNAFEALHLDLQLLRLVLAKPIQPGVFYGVDAEGRTIAALNVSDAQAAREVSTQSLVPVTYQQIRENPICVWAAPFYERLAARFLERETANAISFSLARYAHTITSLDIDTQYLLIAGALGVLVKFLARQPDASATVQTAVKVDARQPKLIRYSLDMTEDTENDALISYAKLLGLRAERAVLTDLDPQAGPLVANELINARRVFEQGAFSEPDGPPLSRQALFSNYNRVQQLRRAYAVVLAHSIGYQGPVNQFLNVAFEQEASWLRDAVPSPEIIREARSFYLVDADLTKVSIWPRFGLPALPENSLVSQFSTFADDFRQTTYGRITARLRLLPHRHTEPVRFSFRLMVNNAPATQVALFTVEIAAEGLIIRGWTDKPISLGTEAELDAFVQALLGSEKLSYEVQRLLLIEEDIQRGEA